jgi:integrase
MPRTVRDKLKVVRQLIKWARKRNLLRADPAAGYDLPPAVKAKAYCWTAGELAAVLDNAPPGFRDLFDFLRLTGLRADELCWLTKDDLSVDPPHVRVRAKTCPVSGGAWRPKHGSERIVPLCADALAVARRAGAASPGPWLFHAPGTRGTQPGRWRKNRLWQAVKAAMRAGGVARGTTHTFRHAFCSFLARRGVSPFAIMKVMGHDSLEIVLQYCHTTERDLLEAIAPVPFGAMLETATGAADGDAVSSREPTSGGRKPAEN